MGLEMRALAVSSPYAPFLFYQASRSCVAWLPLVICAISLCNLSPSHLSTSIWIILCQLCAIIGLITSLKFYNTISSFHDLLWLNFIVLLFPLHFFAVIPLSIFIAICLSLSCLLVSSQKHPLWNFLVLVPLGASIYSIPYSLLFFMG